MLLQGPCNLLRGAVRYNGLYPGFEVQNSQILLCSPCRSVPNKRHMAAVTALFGSSFLGLLKYFFGTWIPSFDQLVTNKVQGSGPGYSLRTRW